MLYADKVALANRARLRMLQIRERELELYTRNSRCAARPASRSASGCADGAPCIGRRAPRGIAREGGRWVAPLRAPVHIVPTSLSSSSLPCGRTQIIGIPKRSVGGFGLCGACVLQDELLPGGWLLDAAALPVHDQLTGRQHPALVAQLHAHRDAWPWCAPTRPRALAPRRLSSHATRALSDAHPPPRQAWRSAVRMAACTSPSSLSWSSTARLFSSSVVASSRST